MKVLHRHLKAAGFEKLPYALIFELEPDVGDVGRLHLHGVLDTSGLTHDQLMRVHQVLHKAAGEANGCLGGARQLKLKAVDDPEGWADYMMKSRAQVRRVMNVESPYMLNQHMIRAARRSYDRLRGMHQGERAIRKAA